MDTSQYLDIFVDETKEHIQVLSDQIMVLEKEPDNSDAIAEIFRSAHSCLLYTSDAADEL